SDQKTPSKNDSLFFSRPLGFTVGKQYRGQVVIINIDPVANKWVVRDDKGTLLKGRRINSLRLLTVLFCPHRT
ncbi:MAG: hypothetical protein ACI81P_002290, partial [Neolewinella sp.]